MYKFFIFYFLVFPCCSVGLLSAQTFDLEGRVVDSLRRGIGGVTIQLTSGDDSLGTGTDQGGNFRFSGISRKIWELHVRSLGYISSRQLLHYTGEETTYVLPLIILQASSRRLQEVEVRAPSPIRVARDTVEYNAAAYALREHDRLEDLLRQLPGVSIDAAGNVTAQGKSMTKLRVNGKDFFTNNVRDFLNQLPAGIIAKLQVIDDYGDQANFTGIKVGKPQKLLNLVIKEGQSKGVFGTTEFSANTQKLWSGALQGNLWLDPHQLSANANTSTNRTEEGRQHSTGMGGNYRQSGDRLNFYVNYGYTAAQQAGDSESYNETATGQGTLYNRMQQDHLNKNQGQQVQFSLQSRGRKDFLDAQVSLQHADRISETHILSKQSGIIVQDLDSHIQRDSKNSNANLSLSWSHTLQKPGRSLSASISGSAQGGSEQSDMYDQLRFYDPVTQLPVKDSVNKRLLDEDRRQSILTMAVKYTEPLHDYTNAKIKRSLDLAYGYTLQHNHQAQDTHAQQQDSQQRVDSLSSDYASLLSTQQLDLSYRAESAKLQYSLGLSVQPIRMLGDDRKQQHISHTLFNLLPIGSIRYSPSLKNSLSFNYTGNLSPPQFDQLMPLRDVRNLQQITVGNPALRPAKSHSLILNFSRVEPVKGQTYSLNLTSSFMQDQIASNLLLLPDTLGSLRRETHYLNVNGSYSLGASYDMTLTFAKHYQFRWSTQVSKNHTITYLDGSKGTNNTIYLSQHMGVDLNTKKIRGALHVNYYITDTKYDLSRGLHSRISTWELSSNARWTISSRLILSADGNYRLNGGYRIAVRNPVLVNASAELFLTARKELSLQLQSYDLLDQQQSVNLQVTAQGVTQRTLNRIGRYGQLSIKYNLSRFGGK